VHARRLRRQRRREIPLVAVVLPAAVALFVGSGRITSKDMEFLIGAINANIWFGLDKVNLRGLTHPWPWEAGRRLDRMLASSDADICRSSCFCWLGI
jgi:hypothetical protein